MKLVLCYELSLVELQNTISFLQRSIHVTEILCLKPDELKLVNLEDYSIYCVHFDLNSEIKTHAELSRWLVQNDYNILNPYLETNNIFDDKLLFAQFLKANEINHPETQVIDNSELTIDKAMIVKARCGTEKKGFADYSKEAFENISLYDDVLLQEKINIKNEFKVLNLLGSLYSDQELELNLKKQIFDLDKLIQDYLSLNNLEKVSIYSMDILEDQKGEYYFLELNLRPGALYRFKEKFSLSAH